MTNNISDKKSFFISVKIQDKKPLYLFAQYKELNSLEEVAAWEVSRNLRSLEHLQQLVLNADIPSKLMSEVKRFLWRMFLLYYSYFIYLWTFYLYWQFEKSVFWKTCFICLLELQTMFEGELICLENPAIRSACRFIIILIKPWPPTRVLHSLHRGHIAYFFSKYHLT